MNNEKIKELDNVSQFILARWMYGIGQPIMEDSEYTLLLEYMKSQNPDSEYLKRSWSSDPCPTWLLEKCGLQDCAKHIPMLDKTESIPSLNSLYEVQTKYSNFNGLGTASMKHDGWNMQFEYNSGRLQSVHSRGRKAANISEYNCLSKLVPETIGIPGPIRIVAEATVSDANFQFCRSTWNSVNNRTAVSSVLANPGYEHLIDLHAFAIHGVDLNGRCKFEVLKELGFNTPEWVYVRDYNSILEAVESLSSMKSTYGSPTDGVVLDDGTSLNAIRIGAWEEPIYHSYVQNYIEDYSSHRISPKIGIYPIVREGVTQRVIPMTNWKRIIANNLEPGSPIAFRVVSGAIADFDEKATKVLQETWSGKYDAYKQRVECEEVAKQCLLHQSYQLSALV